MYKESFKYDNEVFHFKLAKYGNGVLAVQILDSFDAPYCTLSVNLEEKPSEGHFWLKAYSENAPIARFLLEQGLIKMTDKFVTSGHVVINEAYLTPEGLTSSLHKEAATYDSSETDKLMTEELASRDDYGEKSHRGDPSQAAHDYLEDSQNMSGFPKPKHQQELWNRFREWWTNTWKKQKDHDEKGKVGREKGKNSPSRGEQAGTQGEGFWAYKNTPYVAPVQSPAFFMAMPAMKIGKRDISGLSLYDLKQHFIEKLGSVNRESIDQYDDHHISITFEFMLDQIRVSCTWDAKDLPSDISEVQALSRVVKFLEGKLPPTFLKFKQARVEDLDLPNRTITMVIPKGEK
jgi:hypothetical protein